MKQTMVAVLMLAALAGWAAAQKKSGTAAEAMLGAAIHQQEAEGNLQAAIAAYKRILAEHGTNRAVAAQAQFRLGVCYEKLGQGEARKAFERVLSNYADQSELAAQARARLAVLERTNGPASTAMSVRRVWDDAIDIWGTVSADGRYLSFVDWSTGDLALRDLRTGQNRRLTKKPGGWAVVAEAEANTISPDGKYVVYAWYAWDKGGEIGDIRRGRYEIRVIGTDGAGERTVFRDDSAQYMEPHGWSPDMKTIVAAVSYPDRKHAIVMVSLRDSSHRKVHQLEGRWPSKISFSPEGRYLAYSTAGNGSEDLFLLDLEHSPVSASESRIVDHPARDAMGGWSPDGKYILFASDRDGTGGAWLLPMRAGKPSGPAQLVRTRAVDRDRGAVPMGFTTSGAFYYGVANISADAKVMNVDPETGRITGAAETITNRFSGITHRPAWSPDGRRVLYRGPNNTLRIRILDSGEERDLVPQLTQNPQAAPVWYPDGESVLISGFTQRDKDGIYRVSLATGAATLLADMKNAIQPRFVISPDGNTLYYYAPPNRRIIARDLASQTEQAIHEATSSTGHQHMVLSRDGRYLAFGASVISILPTSGGAAREVLRPPLDHQNLFGLDWSPDGKYLYLLMCWKERPGGELWRVRIEDGATQKFESDATLFPYRGIHVHPDGRRIAFTSAQRKNEVWVMENFLPASEASTKSLARAAAR